jgi:hypothetical protein
LQLKDQVVKLRKTLVGTHTGGSFYKFISYESIIKK